MGEWLRKGWMKLKQAYWKRFNERKANERMNWSKSEWKKKWILSKGPTDIAKKRKIHSVFGNDRPAKGRWWRGYVGLLPVGEFSHQNLPWVSRTATSSPSRNFVSRTSSPLPFWSRELMMSEQEGVIFSIWKRGLGSWASSVPRHETNQNHFSSFNLMTKDEGTDFTLYVKDSAS